LRSKVSDNPERPFGREALTSVVNRDAFAGL
jgi:hypothetical protein